MHQPSLLMPGFIKRFITPGLSTHWQIAHPPSLAFPSKPYFFWAIFASINSSSQRKNFSPWLGRCSCFQFLFPLLLRSDWVWDYGCPYLPQSTATSIKSLGFLPRPWCTPPLSSIHCPKFQRSIASGHPWTPWLQWSKPSVLPCWAKAHFRPHI